MLSNVLLIPDAVAVVQVPVNNLSCKLWSRFGYLADMPTETSKQVATESLTIVLLCSVCMHCSLVTTSKGAALRASGMMRLISLRLSWHP